MTDNREALISAIQRLPHNGTCLWQSGNDDCDCHKAEAMRLARLAPSLDEGPLARALHRAYCRDNRPMHSAADHSAAAIAAEYRRLAQEGETP